MPWSAPGSASLAPHVRFASLDHHIRGLQDRRSLEPGCQAQFLDRVAGDGSAHQERACFDLD
jgi:hypothetical protein